MFNFSTPAGEEVQPAQVSVSQPKILETAYNRIYFYSEIERSSILNLNKNLRDLCNNQMLDAQVKDMKTPIPINLHINSFGGGIFYGLAGMDEIIKISNKVPIYTIIDGCCASAGTFLSVVGTKRYINKHAFVLIHQLSSVMWGKYEEFKDEIKNLDKLMETIKQIYKERTNLPEDKLDEILKHDLWFNAKECVEYGIVDEVL